MCVSYDFLTVDSPVCILRQPIIWKCCFKNNLFLNYRQVYLTSGYIALITCYIHVAPPCKKMPFQPQLHAPPNSAENSRRD